jgi:signal transduction histidine kinase
MDLNTLTSTPQTRIICGITIKVVELILTIILVNSGVKINKLIQYKKSNTLIQLMALQTIVIAILIMCVTSNNSYESNKILYSVSVVFVYILLLGLTMIDFKERERLQTIQNRFRAQEEYIQNIENMLMIIRREKHDFANHLNTILAMCTLNKPDTVTKIGSYINKLSGRLVNAYHFYNTGNDYVDGMLAVKSSLAFEQDIRFEADFNASLKELSLNDCDITCVIGNITDNAFEAIMATGECENKYIAISTYDDNFFYYISISNNGPAICEKDAEKIFSNGYSTKSSNKLDHGFGLFIVEQVVKKNKGVITVSSTEEKTEFLIKFLKEGNAYGKTG